MKIKMGGEGVLLEVIWKWHSHGTKVGFGRRRVFCQRKAPTKYKLIKQMNYITRNTIYCSYLIFKLLEENCESGAWVEGRSKR
jgi:hypothetical protein